MAFDQRAYWSTYHKKYYLAHKEEIQQKSHEYYLKCRDTGTRVNKGKRAKPAQCHPNKPHRAKGLCESCYRNQYQRRKYHTDSIWRARRLLSRANAQRRKLYGLSPEDYASLLQVQQGRCAICKIELGKRPLVDHDHRTARVRGLLCKYCNCDLLGVLETNSSKILSALHYLAIHSALPELFAPLLNPVR